MNRFITFLAGAAVWLSASARTSEPYTSLYTDLPVEVACVTPVTFPSRSACITGHGAVGDGVKLNTAAIQSCIDSLAALGGGTVEIPGGVWLTGPLELRSNICLNLAPTAILYFSPDKSLYYDGPRSRFKPGITARNCTNIGITGRGLIDGNGAQWRPVKRGKVSQTEWSRFKDMGGVERGDGNMWYPWALRSGYPDMFETPEQQEGKRNDLFRVFDCKGILLKDVTFQNAPKFHVHPFNSENIIIDGVTVRCPWNAQNGDAIDLSDCHRCLIVGATVDAGDDGICLKSGSAKNDTDINGVHDVLIQDCVVYAAHGGFVIGSEDICGIERVVCRDCRFSGTETGLRFKSAISRGGVTRDIHICRVMMSDIIHSAVTFECTYNLANANVKPGEVDQSKPYNIPEFTDIHISNVVCRGCKTGVSASGIKGFNCVHDIDISDCTFVYTREATAIDTATARVELTNVNFVADRNQ